MSLIRATNTVYESKTGKLVAVKVHGVWSDLSEDGTETEESRNGLKYEAMSQHELTMLFTPKSDAPEVKVREAVPARRKSIPPICP